MAKLWRYKSALVTGASSGLGKEFALQLAHLGTDVVLVARRRGRLREVAKEVKRLGRNATVVVADLEKPEDRHRVTGHLKRNRVDLLINNAGYGKISPFHELSLEDIGGQMTLNCHAPTEFLYHAIHYYRSEGIPGGIINVASEAAFIPVPFMATYAATKAYLRSLSESLSYELAALNIQVAVVCPGLTESEFFDRAGEEGTKMMRMMPTAECVEIALHKFQKGNTLIITGAENELMKFIATRVPSKWVSTAIGRLLNRAMHT